MRLRTTLLFTALTALTSIALAQSTPGRGRGVTLNSTYPAYGLAAEYRLNEGVGSTAFDSGPKALNASWTGTAAGATGYYSPGAVSLFAGFFDGSTNYIDAGANSALGPALMSITAWVYPTALTNAYSTVVQKGSGSDYYELYVKSTGKIAAYLASTSGGTCTMDGAGTAVLTTNTWHFVALTWDGTHGNIYVDGVQDSTTGCPTGPLATTAHLFIGKDNVTTGRQWTGRLNDVRIYNRALSASEISAMTYLHN